MPSSSDSSRASAIRAAVRSLVAERGFHGASMSAVANKAGVAAGTAYTYYDSKDDLLLDAYLEAKQQLGDAAVTATGDAEDLRDHFIAMWTGAYDHLAANPEVARFILQVDSSPYRAAAVDHLAHGGGDALSQELERSGLKAVFADLPKIVLYDLALTPAVRLAAAGTRLSPADRHTMAVACWNAVTTDAQGPPARA